MWLIKNCIVFSLFTSLLGCQQVHKKYCEQTNWRKEAFFSALQGQNRKQLLELQQQCQKFQVTINVQAYNEGFDEGAIQFCSTESGKDYGARGEKYNGTCEGHSNELHFLKSYKLGRLKYLKKQVKLKKIQLEESEARLWRKHNEFELESNTNPALAVKAYDDLESFKAENERLKSELQSLNKLIEDLNSKEI